MSFNPPPSTTTTTTTTSSSTSSPSPSMVKPTFFQRVLGRPSQRYSAPTTTPDNCHIQDTHGYRRTPEEPLQLNLRFPEDTDEPFFTPASSPFHSNQGSPSTTPPASAASSSLSLTDGVRPSTSLPDHVSLPMPQVSQRKITYTDEDWARDVRWLVAPRIDEQKPKSRHVKHCSTPLTAQLPTSRSTPSLQSRLPASVSLTYPPPLRAPKFKGIGKAKISTARSVIGMTTLLEVEEDLDSDLAFPYPRDIPVPQKRTSIYRLPERSPDAYHKPRVSSPLCSSKPTRQRSFSSPPFLLTSDQTPDSSGRPSDADPSFATTSLHASSLSLRQLSTSSHTTVSTSKSPYTSPAPNVLDALAAHVSVSDSHDTLPSTGTRGYSSLVLPHATTTPSLALDHGSHRVWKIGKALHTTVCDGIGIGDQVDLSRSRLAQTTMASIEIVRGIAVSSGTNRKSHKSRGGIFGVAWFSKDKLSTAAHEKNYQLDTDSPLGFAAYRTPPVYVGAGSVLVQVWAVGLDGTDARLTGIYPPRASSSLVGAPYGTKMPKTNEKDKGRIPPVGYIPGRSFVGRVLEVGWEVGTDLAKRGDWVVGLMSVHKCGALAEFVLADRHRVHRVANPFMHLKYPFTSASQTETIANGVDDDSKRRDSLLFPANEESLTVNEFALLPLCGVPAYRAVRTFHQITQRMGKSQLPYGDSHNELHPIIPPRSDKHDFTAGGDQEDMQVHSFHSKPRALILRAHDGAGAFSVQMLVREGWSIWAHVPVPFMLPGPQSELPDELKDEEQERVFDNQRKMLRRIEDRLRDWGADEVIFVPVTSMPLSSLFDASNAVLEATLSLSSPSIQFSSSPSSSPSISPSPFSRSATSTPLSSPYSHVLSSGHLSSSPSSSSHQIAFTTPYSFTPLPLTSYDCEQGSVVSLLSYLTRSRVRLDAILDTVGGREIWDASRLLLSRPVRDPPREDVEAQFTTLVGDTPDRVVSTVGDNFRAGIRALRLGGAKDQHSFEDSGYHEVTTNGGDKDKKAKAKPRPVNYSWVNVVSDIDWEGSDVHDTLCAVTRIASSEGVKPVIGPPDFANNGCRDKGKKPAASAAGGIEERLLGKVVSFENTPDAFLYGGGLEHGGTIVSRVVE